MHTDQHTLVLYLLNAKWRGLQTDCVDRPMAGVSRGVKKEPGG